ncbi:MAG TPA: sensor domain-containing diguanylate cyclase [Planctomycetota bacterium]|nr:sensor domain-containing diguanylate cyclase [Planctomycetota bacterium]
MPKRSAPKRPGAARDLQARIRDLEAENRALRARLESIPASHLMPLGEIAEEFNTLDLDRIAKVATQRISALVGARLCSLFLYDYEAQELVLAAHTHPRPLPERISLKAHRHSVMDLVLAARKTLQVHGFHVWESTNKTRLDRSFSGQYETESCLSVPLMTANYVVGVLNLADKENGEVFDVATEVPAVEHLARVLAMAIRNCRLFREVQNQAHTDALTGLRNYRAFHETLRTEIHRSQRYGRPLGLIMLDIDSFKALNDRHGHLAGDAALTELGKVIRAATRREDFSARYGGDEIAILLPETPPPGCLSVVRRLVKSVREHEFLFDGTRLPVTVSIGVAFFKTDMSITQLVGAADQALYKAKQAGKDRFVTADP